MAKKSGKAGNAVTPTAPEKPVEPDTTEPGEADEEEAFTQPDEEEAEELSWIEIEMVDDDGEPVTSGRFKLELSDGRVARGTLDNEGFARVEGIPPGNCKITFPDLDAEAWEMQ